MTRAAPATPPKSDLKSVAARAAVHLVNVYDGVVGRRLHCKRCHRLLGEDRFARVGVRDMPGRSGRVLTALHPHCHTCREQAKGIWIKHPEYSPKLDRFWAAKFATTKAGAHSRGLLFTLDKDDLLGKYLEQDGRCALTGLKMQPFENGLRPSVNDKAWFHSPSTDRIDSNGHYTLDNIQIVLLGVNLMKGDMPQDMFFELCSLIATKNLIG